MFTIKTTKGKIIKLKLYHGCPKADAVAFMKQSYPEYKIKTIVRS